MNKLRARSLSNIRRRAFIPVALFNIFVILSANLEGVICLDDHIDVEENEGALGFLRAVEQTIEAKTMWFYRHFGANIDPSKIRRANRCDYSKTTNSINCPPASDKNIPKQNPNLYAGAQTGDDNPLSLKNRASFISIPPRCLEDPDGPDCRNLRSLTHDDTPLPGIGMINDETDLITFGGAPTLAPESDTQRDLFLTAKPTPPVGALSTFEPTRDMCYGNHDSFKQSAVSGDEMTNVRGKWCESSMPSVSLEPTGAPSVFLEGGREVEYGYLSESPSSKPSTGDWNPPPGLEFKDKAWSVVPSNQPSDEPSLVPSISPSGRPSDGPSLYPSISPSERPSEIGGWNPPPGLEFKGEAWSSIPSKGPSDRPSPYPSIYHSERPSLQPSIPPSEVVSETPSTVPSIKDWNPPPGLEFEDKAWSSIPSKGPTVEPSLYPSVSPSEKVSGNPSTEPSTRDWNPPPVLELKNPASSFVPSKQPSGIPSLYPSVSLSEIPSGKPSAVPLSKDWNPPPAFQGGPTTSSIPSIEPSKNLSERPSISTSSSTPTVTKSSVPTTEQPTDEPTEQSTEQPVYQVERFQPVEQPTVQPVDEPRDREPPVEQPIEQPAEDPTDEGQPGTQPVEQPVEAQTDQPSEEPTEVVIPPISDSPTSSSPTASPSVTPDHSASPSSEEPTTSSPTEAVTSYYSIPPTSDSPISNAPTATPSVTSDAPTSLSPTSIPSISPTVIQSNQPTDCYDLYGITESDIIEQTGSVEPIPEDSIRVISGEDTTLTIGKLQ